MRLTAALVTVGLLLLLAAYHRPPVCIRAHRAANTVVCDAYAAR